MDWLFDNPQILVFIGLALAAWLKNRGESKEEEESERRAREEMIRGLKELKRTSSSPTMQKPGPPRTSEPQAQPWSTSPMEMAPPPLPGPVEIPEPHVWQAPAAARKAEPAPWGTPHHPAADAASPWTPGGDEAQQEILQRQQALQERLAEIKRTTEKPQHGVGGARATQRRLEHHKRKDAVDLPPLRDALRDPRQTRRAIVLREILGPPIGLR